MPGVVIVGTGFGCITHLRALRAAGFDVVALVGRDPDKTRARADRFEVPYGLTDLGDALARPGVDAVAVATPPFTHSAITLDAIAAGKHVLCEKPFARNAAEAQLMLEAADAAGVVHVLGTEFRWATGQASMARVVRAGTVGAPRLATFLLHIPMLADPAGEVPAWWGRADEGGGWLGAQGTHVIDQVRVMLGEFEGVTASLTQVSARDWDVEDAFTVHFRTRSGVAARRRVCRRSIMGWISRPIILRHCPSRRASAKRRQSRAAAATAGEARGRPRTRRWAGAKRRLRSSALPARADRR